MPETTMTMRVRVPLGKCGYIETGPFTGADLKRATDQLRKKNGKPPMKQDAQIEAGQEGTYRVAASELRSFIERFERLDAEKKDITEQQKDVMGEAKSRGYDTKVLRKIIALRKRDAADIAAEDAIMEIYKEALGM